MVTRTNKNRKAPTDDRTTRQAESEHADLEQTVSLGTKLVTKLLDRHHVPPRSRASRLESALGLNYQRVRRRLQDHSAWTIEELDRVAQSFGESLESMVSEHSDSMPRAIFRVGEIDLECRANVAGPVTKTSSPRLVAVRDTSTPTGDNAPYVVMLADAHYTGEPHEVIRVVLEGTAKRQRVAVLDDDRDFAQAMATTLAEYGYEAKPLFSHEQAEAAITDEALDGYILHWMTGNKLCETLIARIRRLDSACPILVLTNEMTPGSAAERDVLAMARRYRFMCYEKPVKPSVIRSALEVWFAMPAPR